MVIERAKVGPVTHLCLHGTIDETFSLALASVDLSGHVIFDLGRVDRITPTGVRQWMELTRAARRGRSTST